MPLALGWPGEEAPRFHAVLNVLEDIAQATPARGDKYQQRICEMEIEGFPVTFVADIYKPRKAGRIVLSARSGWADMPVE